MVHSAIHVRVVCGIVYEKVSVLHVMYRIYTFIQGTLTFCSMALRQKPACIFHVAINKLHMHADVFHGHVPCAIDI